MGRILEAGRLRDEITQIALEHLDHSVWFLDASGRLVLGNSSAMQLVQQQDAFQLRKGRFHAVYPREDAQLQEHIRRAAELALDGHKRKTSADQCMARETLFVSGLKQRFRYLVCVSRSAERPGVSCNPIHFSLRSGQHEISQR